MNDWKKGEGVLMKMFINFNVENAMKTNGGSYYIIYVFNILLRKVSLRALYTDNLLLVLAA